MRIFNDAFFHAKKYCTYLANAFDANVMGIRTARSSVYDFWLQNVPRNSVLVFGPHLANQFATILFGSKETQSVTSRQLLES